MNEPPCDRITARRRGRLLAWLLWLSLVLGASACVSVGDGPTTRVRPRLGAPEVRLDAGRVPSNARIDVRCEFEDVLGGAYGYGDGGLEVRCPEDDVERYLAAIGFTSRPPVEEPPDVEVTVRFDPTAMPQMDRCEGSAPPLPLALPAVRRFDPTRASFSSREIGAVVDLMIEEEGGRRRVESGVGYARGVDCGPYEVVRSAEGRFAAALARRVSEAISASLDSAVLGRASTRPDFTPAPATGSPSPRQRQSAGVRPAPLAPTQSTSSATSRTSDRTSRRAAAAPAPAILVPPGGFGRYSALVIGIDEYAHLPNLGNAVHDARTVGGLLRDDYGYEVRVLENPSRAEILQALVALRRTLGERDNLLIYYAGHGWLDPEADEGYWLPRDADREDPTHWISNDTITAQLRALRAHHVMVVADSCYSGKLVRGVRVGPRPTDYYARMAERKARVVLSSGGLEPVGDAGGKGGHSVFAAAFLDVLRENAAIVDGSTLFSRIRRPVMTNADQIPEYADIRLAGHDGGDFLFVRKGVE